MGIWSNSGRHDANGLALFSLIELHGLLTELFPIVTMLLLQLPHLGLQQLHIA